MKKLITILAIITIAALAPAAGVGFGGIILEQTNSTYSAVAGYAHSAGTSAVATVAETLTSDQSNAFTTASYGTNVYTIGTNAKALATSAGVIGTNAQTMAAIMWTNTAPRFEILNTNAVKWVSIAVLTNSAGAVTSAVLTVTK